MTIAVEMIVIRYGYEDDEDLIRRAEDIATRRDTGVAIRFDVPSGHIFGSPGSSGHRRRRPVAFTEESTSARCGSETPPSLRVLRCPHHDDRRPGCESRKPNRGLGVFFAVRS